MIVKRVAIIFGGKSAEHEVSLRSARNVLDAMDRDRYEPVLVWIAKDGAWYVVDEELFLQATDSEEELEAQRGILHKIVFLPEGHGEIFDITAGKSLTDVHIVFPVLHGPMGEDGTIQGVLKVANVPFVGAGVLGSAVSMDKDIMKRLLRDAGVPTARSVIVRSGEYRSYAEVSTILGVPFFLKPANLGSSIGVSKVSNVDQYETALDEAFLYDRKVIIEEYIRGREIECSVLGNKDPKTSIPGEIIVHDEFYSYDTKYISETGAALSIPAELTEEEVQKVQEVAVDAYKALECEGLGRVDFFLTHEGEVLVNEINTLPGFTSISMYPKLWEVSGLSYTKLVTKLLELAEERFIEENKLQTSR